MTFLGVMLLTFAGVLGLAAVVVVACLIGWFLVRVGQAAFDEYDRRVGR